MDAASDSAALLREFAESRSEAAFAALVSRHLGLVYATALRRGGGRPALAEEACQIVFIDLARKAARVPSTMPLAGWLHRHACHVTAGLLRTEARRARREELAMQHRHSAEDTDWSRLAPLLDEALLSLPAADRAALVLRFLDQRPLAEVGAGLRVTENAARMRVDRALDRLRARLSRQGITSTASALAAVFAGPAVVGPPPALAATVTSAALAAGGAVASTLGLLSLMASTKLKTAAVAALILGAGTALVVQHQAGERLRRDNATLRGQLAALSAEAEAGRRAAAEAAALHARPSEELLGLRGEVARLRRELARPAARPASAPAVPAPVADEPEPAAAPFTAKVQAVVPPGHTLVAGGWEWSDGRRGLLLVTPTTQISADGSRIVEIEHKTALVPDALLDELGLAALRTGEAASGTHGILDTQQAAALIQAFEERGGVEILASPRITTADGRQAGIGLTGDDVPYQISFDVTPTVNADGQIELNAEGRAEPRPPIPGR